MFIGTTQAAPGAISKLDISQTLSSLTPTDEMIEEAPQNPFGGKEKAVDAPM